MPGGVGTGLYRASVGVSDQGRSQGLETWGPEDLGPSDWDQAAMGVPPTVTQHIGTHCTPARPLLTVQPPLERHWPWL